MKNLEKHIGYWLRFVSNQVSGSFAKALLRYGISVAEWVVLCLLEKENSSPARIASQVGMTRGATTKVLAKLFNKGLISRTGSVLDRRFQDIHLTCSGREILPKLIKVADENDSRFFGRLSEIEQKKLISILKQMIEDHEPTGIPFN